MIFETPRLIARRFAPRDLTDFVSMRSDPEVARFQGWESFSEDDGRRFIDDLAGKEPGQPGWFQFALEDKATRSFAGDCGLNIHADDGRLARIGYTLARAFWNRGLATEAVAGLAAYAFERFPIHRITASVDPRNVASCRVLEKAGFVKEGHFRQSEWFKGAWADDAIYARLR
ncbi:N-acetyltransferase [Aestuariivirga litoralis]|uniref:N-acetyltransferase n=1 Tax=Aestuariivirga litoralis TaxID=2650924 RepID=A0A2W2AJ23_9HYPH|nr:GNAT family N-acetyltransferase [Aestuariivirga litoralis]PZF75445.1 N-acetyltransferase [Aestuariivirga litoralis]